MKTLIVYDTRHGSSEKATKMLQQQIDGEVVVHHLKKSNSPGLSEFERVIVGGSIHMGEIQKSVKTFCELNKEELSRKHLGLFLCCMDKERAQEQFEKAYPDVLREKALINALFGGEFIFDRMNFLERFAVRKISGVHTSVSEIDEETIARFANKFNLLPR